MGDTAIEWTDGVWNVVRGCSRISPGCGGGTPGGGGGCYAERQAIRQAGPSGNYEGLVESTPAGPRWTGKVRLVAEKLDEPLRWKRPRRVFVNSMSDLFHEGLQDKEIAQVFAVMALARQHTFQVLTKRAERMAALSADESFQGLVLSIASMEATRRRMELAPGELRWPVSNVWLGVSVENRKHGLPRLEHLRRTVAALRFISAEPLLEDLGPVDLSGIKWAIGGGESGPGSRACDVDWLRSFGAQCAAQGTAYFCKQLGAKAISHDPAEMAWLLTMTHSKRGDIEEWPPALRIRQWPEVTT